MDSVCFNVALTIFVIGIVWKTRRYYGAKYGLTWRLDDLVDRYVGEISLTCQDGYEWSACIPK
jgi:hypothetical protein